MKPAYPMSPTEQATFTLSIDFELLWGTADRPYAADFHNICESERRDVIDRLLTLFEEFDISATWGIVGHLFLNRPSQADPAHHGQPDLYYAPDQVERIRQCKVRQDIGSHSFRHIEMGEAKCSRKTAASDVAECVRQADKWGIEMKSFIFPRNLVGHLDVLKRHGFTCYRGPEPHWYARKRRTVRRLGHLLEIAAARTPPTVMPVEEDGVWNIAGSMLYTPSFGTRRYLPVWMRVLRAKRGLDRAVALQRIFHLWFHPTDLVCRKDAMMDGLRRILEHAANLRAAGKLVVRPMCDLVPAARFAESERKASVVA